MKSVILSCISLIMSWNSFGQGGLLDSSFSNDGIVTKFEDGGAMSVAIQSDGKIVVGVYDGTEGFGVLRLNSDGSTDNSFGGDGFTKTTIGLGYNNLTTIAIQADGKIIAGGNCIDFDGYNKGGLARFNPDGSLDQSFNGGKFLYSYNSPGYYNHATDLATTSDQKIITAGVSVDNQYESIFALARFNSNGSLDAGFGLNGIVWTYGITEYFDVLDMVIQPDGGILLVGGLPITDRLGVL